MFVGWMDIDQGELAFENGSNGSLSLGRNTSEARVRVVVG